MDTDRQVAHTTSRPHHGGGGGGAGGREDCWSDGATETLIEAWGDSYLRLNRGNLRQDWKEVADAVNARQKGVKPRRTDVQCKNRVDTRKKKYKLENAKSVPSKWPFYYRLDHLIGTTTAVVTPSNQKAAALSPPLPKPPTTVTLTVKSTPKPNP